MERRGKVHSFMVCLVLVGLVTQVMSRSLDQKHGNSLKTSKKLSTDCIGSDGHPATIPSIGHGSGGSFDPGSTPTPSVPTPSHGGSYGTPTTPSGGSYGTPTTPSHGHGGYYGTPATPSHGSGGSYGTPTTPSIGHGGSYGTPTTPSHGSGGHYETPTTPSHGNGGSYGTPTTPSHGSSGGYYGTPTTPSHGSGGSYGTPATPSIGHGGSHQAPTTPSHGSGGYYGTPSTPSHGNGGSYGTPTTPSGGETPIGGGHSSPAIDPSPSTPTPFFPGTCTYWGTHPDLVVGVIGYWGTMDHVFGVACISAFGRSLTLHDALTNTRDDGIGALFREGTASLLNSMSSTDFPFNSQQVKDSFSAALLSDGAAAAQAAIFKQANEGKF